MRSVYLTKANEAWQARHELLATLLINDAPSNRLTSDELARNCTDAAKSLYAISPVGCREWSRQIVRFTNRAAKVLAYSEAKPFRQY